MNPNTLIAEIAKYTERDRKNAFNQVSPIWNDIFGTRRGRVPQVSDMENFLSPASRQTAGVSTWQHALGKGLQEYLSEHLDMRLLQSLPMPPVGNPQLCDFRGQTVSVAYLLRFLTWQKSQLALDHLDPSSKIDVVEIGAGYGCIAELWIRSGRVNSYTIIDLPENLYNSAYYLMKTTGWEVRLVDDVLREVSPNTIHLVTPGQLERIAFAEYDLALNTDSLGEMPKETAVAYVGWLAEHLKKGGLFFSKNGHRRGSSNAGVPAVSEYGYQRFELLSLAPSSTCTSAFDDFSHVALLRRSEGEARWEPGDVVRLDTLSNLYATGLSQDLAAISERYSRKSLTADDLLFLEWCRRFFEGADAVYGGAHLRHVAAYLTGLKAGLSGKECAGWFREFLEEGESDIAISYAVMFLRYYGAYTPDIAEKVSQRPGVRLYSSESAAFARQPWPLREVKFQLRFEIIANKIHPYRPVSRSLLMKTKDLLRAMSGKRTLVH